MALPFAAEITDAYLNSAAAFTSASTVYEALKRAAKAVNPAAYARTGYPSRNQVKDVLTTIDIAQTTKPYKLNPAEFDTIISRNRGAGRQGRRRHQVQLDLAIFERWWKSNRLRQTDSKANSFLYGAVFIDVYSRLCVVYPIQNKNAATLKRVVQQAWDFYGGFENLTVDGESALNQAANNVNSTKAWLAAKQPPTRLWINETPTRGKSTTYLVERAIRTLKERIYKRARAEGSRNWSLPDNAYWAANPPPAAAALGLPANATLPQRKRRVASSDTRVPSMMNEVVRQYNLSQHRTLGTTPANVFFNAAKPLYARNERLYGTCTQGAACSPKQKKGVRKRAITTLFKVGDTVRLLKTVRAFDRKSELKVWTAGLWTVVADMFPTGLARYDAGPNPNVPIKAGQSRRFLVRKVGGTEEKQVLHWQMLKINPAKTVVVTPVGGSNIRMESLSGRASGNLTNLKTSPIKLTGTKAQMGRRGQRFTQTARADAATVRARQLEDLDDLDVNASDDEEDGVSTRAQRAPISARVGKRRAATAAAKKTSPKMPPAKAKKKFKVGNRVTAYYPGLKASYTGVVSDMDSDSGDIAVEFDPTGNEPQGSSVVFKKPYSFLKRLP